MFYVNSFFYLTGNLFKERGINEVIQCGQPAIQVHYNIMGGCKAELFLAIILVADCDYRSFHNSGIFGGA